MNSVQCMTADEIPAHVPAELIRSYLFALGNLTAVNPYDRMVHDVHRNYPPIFWVRDLYPGGSPAWVVRRFADLRAIYSDGEHFSVKGFCAIFHVDWRELGPCARLR
ncbi:MAG: hypothetical protein HC869_12765 [Rhodospirillales bacterium]|nr:hypothetical protein [Rhodospirillales bacterium]